MKIKSFGVAFALSLINIIIGIWVCFYIVNVVDIPAWVAFPTFITMVGAVVLVYVIPCWLHIRSL